MENNIIILLVLAAVSYLGFRLYKSFSKKKCGDKNCGCG
ncbi:MAG: FeoB-associated Cys-rich membrane protein [Bacteroidota bacterium]